MSDKITEILRAWVLRGGYALEDASERINTLMASGAILAEDGAALLVLAEAHAVSADEPTLAELKAQVDMLEECVIEMAGLLYAG